MRHHIGSGIASRCYFHFFLIGKPHKYFRLMNDWFQNTIFITATPYQISYCNKCRHPDSIAVCQHGYCFLVHIIAMFQTVHTCLDCSSCTVNSVCMTHDSQTLFVGNVYHLFDFRCVHRSSRYFSVIIKVQ